MSLARKDVPITEEHRAHIRTAVLLGYRDGTRRVGSTEGRINGNWRGGVSAFNKTARNIAMQTPEYRTWRTHVFNRDDYTCQACGVRGGVLQADHELPYALFPDLRYEVLNGRTLCVACHRKTSTYGTRALTAFI